MGNELWEIVPVADVVVGEHVKTYDGSEIVWTERDAVHSALRQDDHVFRRVDPADDPRVLRRALEIAAKWFANRYTYANAEEEMNKAIDQARRELETEADQ